MFTPSFCTKLIKEYTGTDNSPIKTKLHVLISESHVFTLRIEK